MLAGVLSRGRKRSRSRACSLELMLSAEHLLARGWAGYVPRGRNVCGVSIGRMLTVRAVGLLPVQSLMGGAVVLMVQCTMTLPWGLAHGQGQKGRCGGYGSACCQSEAARKQVSDSGSLSCKEHLMRGFLGAPKGSTSAVLRN